MELIRYVTVGQYVPGDSAVHRLDPRTKLIATLVFMVVIFLIPGFAGQGAFTAFLLALIVAARISLGYVLRGLRPVFFLLVLSVTLNLFFGSDAEGGRVLWRLGPFVATWGGLVRGLFVSYRLVLLVVATSLLTFTTSPVSLADGMERLLRPFQRLGVPAHELAMMMTIALRFIPTLLEETEKILKAQMARGADFTSGGLMRRLRALLPILVPLFVSAFRRADELAQAMEARCYRGGESRTRMKELRYAAGDLVALAVTVAVSLAFAMPPDRWLRLVSR